MVQSHVFAALILAGRCFAELHHLFTSSFSTPHLYSLEFDDEKNSIVDIANITAHDGHPWISFSYDKGSLYAGESDGFASYAVENSTSLVYSQSVKVQAECGGKKDGLGSPYVVAELRAPFTVFGASSSSCGVAMSVEPDGKLQSLVQSFKYRDGSAIKGLALDPDNRYLYSADENNNGIWVHLVNDQGTVNQVGFTASPIANSGPKHVIVHPDGKYLYAILSRANTVAVFAINSGTGSDTNRLAFTGITYSLTPPGAANAEFSGDDVLLSADANVLFATTRFVGQAAPPPRANPQPSWPWGQVGEDNDDDDYRAKKKVVTRATRPGYITAILLTPLSERDSPQNNRVVGSGFPLRQIFQLATTTSGGNSNSISPAPWSSDYFALADSEYGLIEVWKINNLASTNYAGSLAVGAKTAPVGGWSQNNWARTGVLVASGTTVTTEEPNPRGNPRETVTVTQFAQPTPTRQPNTVPWLTGNNGWRPGQSGGSNDPWGASGAQSGNSWGLGSTGFPWGRAGEDVADRGRRNLRSGDEEVKQQEELRGSTESTEEEESSSEQDESPEKKKKVISSGWTWEPIETTKSKEPKPFLSRILNLGMKKNFRMEKRQFFGLNIPGLSNPGQSNPGSNNPQVVDVPAGPPITAKIVASWRAPVGGGNPGRLFTATTQQRYAHPHVMRVKPWTGSKKRDLKGGSRGAAEPPPPPTQEQLASYIKAQSEGRSCCTNAAWFD